MTLLPKQLHIWYIVLKLLSYVFLFLFLFWVSQLVFVLLVFSSSHGRLYRKIPKANGAEEITAQDNSLSKFLGSKEAMSDAFDELSDREDIDREKASIFEKGFNAAMSEISKIRNCLTKTAKKKVCKAAPSAFGNVECNCKTLLCEKCACILRPRLEWNCSAVHIQCVKEGIKHKTKNKNK